ncbi:MAG: hypothetical protein WA960_14955 [Tunicatimonas sp.]
MKKNTITAEMAAARLAIGNALEHAIIKKRLAAVGYDQKTLLAGKALTEEVYLLCSVQQDKYAAQYEGTDTLQEQLAEVRARYQQHVKRARLAFEGQRNVRELLQINGKRKTDTVGQLDQIYAFYTKIEQYLEVITRYDVRAEELAQTKALVEALQADRRKRAARRGDAQHATQERNQKRRALKDWMAQFKKAARLALHKEPQLLEVLGIQVASQRV